MNSEYEQSMQRGRQQWGDKFDTGELDAAPWFAQYFGGPRVKVEGPSGIRFGVVSRTTGWRPAFLLIHRSSDIGSSDVLGRDDLVIAVREKNSTYSDITGSDEYKRLAAERTKRRLREELARKLDRMRESRMTEIKPEAITDNSASQADYGIRPTHVVVDTEDGYVFSSDSNGILTEVSARTFAATRNAERNAENRKPYMVFALVPQVYLAPLRTYPPDDTWPELRKWIETYLLKADEATESANATIEGKVLSPDEPLPEDADDSKTFTEDDQGNWHEVTP